MTDEELKKLVESNARKAQAILDLMAEDRLKRQKLRSVTIGFENVMERLTSVEEAIAKMLADLD